jgi:hypothetical protein
MNRKLKNLFDLLIVLNGLTYVPNFLLVWKPQKTKTFWIFINLSSKIENMAVWNV